jgi:hypothetical protein
MNEKLLERKLCAAVKRLGGRALKFTSPYYTGMPDRIMLLPDGRVCFAEIKTTGKKPTRRQKAVIADLQELGFRVFVVDDLDTLDACLCFCKGGDAA